MTEPRPNATPNTVVNPVGELITVGEQAAPATPGDTLR